MMLAFRGACGEPPYRSALAGSHLQGSICAPASASKTASKLVPRRMPCRKYIQAAGTQKSRTLRSNQLYSDEHKKHRKSNNLVGRIAFT
jgi:hypothetical protein